MDMLLKQIKNMQNGQQIMDLTAEKKYKKK